MSSSPLAQPGSFKNRVVIVTGAAGSIGRPLCLALAKAGAFLVVNDLGASVIGEGSSASPAKTLADEITELGTSAIASNHDVATQGQDIVSLAKKAFGRVDVIINAAGIIRYKSVPEHTITDFKEIMDVNTMGAISLILAAWPHFIKQKYGRIVNFTSDSTFGMANLAAYITSKSALIGATRAFATEGEGYNIKVNCVSPTSFSRMGGEDIEDDGSREAFRRTFQGEGNAPMILALAHENISVNGQTFSTGAFAVNHLVQGYRPALPKLQTMEDCLRNAEQLVKDGAIEAPGNVFQYMESQSRILQFSG